MQYRNPDINSSYKLNDLGSTLFAFVLLKKPKIIIEFGTLGGYSAIAMAMALDEIGSGKIICYDLWDQYPYNHTSQETAQKNINRYGLSKYIELKKMDYYEWLNNPEPFDMIHLDISNDGDVIRITHEKLKKQIENGAFVVFEGGSVLRDNVWWMKKFKKKPINDLKELTGYYTINHLFPSISVL